MTYRYYVFYVDAYGMKPERVEFDEASELLAFVAKVNEDKSRYINFRAIYGEQLEFEPFERVTAWRIKEDDS